MNYHPLLTSFKGSSGKYFSRTSSKPVRFLAEISAMLHSRLQGPKAWRFPSLPTETILQKSSTEENQPVGTF